MSMRGIAMVVGGIVGGRLFGWRGALLGAGVGWGFSRLLLEEESPKGRAEPDPGERYPEEEMVAALSEAEGDEATLAAELDSLYRGAGGEEAPPAGETGVVETRKKQGGRKGHPKKG
jgi:hypothetical protein